MLLQTWKYLLIVVMVPILSQLMTKLQTLSTSLGIIQVSLWIKNKNKNDQSFSFGPVTYNDNSEKVKTLDTANGSQQSDIPTKILKQNLDYFAEYFYENINQCILKSAFPSHLKLADVTPVYIKKSKNSKDSHRLVIILPHISKIYKRCIYDQIQLFFDSLLYKYQYGFCRG